MRCIHPLTGNSFIQRSFLIQIDPQFLSDKPTENHEEITTKYLIFPHIYRRPRRQAVYFASLSETNPKSSMPQ
jgi:hypothetical protein